eukprot:g48828.t1
MTGASFCVKFANGTKLENLSFEEAFAHFTESLQEDGSYAADMMLQDTTLKEWGYTGTKAWKRDPGISFA